MQDYWFTLVLQQRAMVELVRHGILWRWTQTIHHSERRNFVMQDTSIRFVFCLSIILVTAHSGAFFLPITMKTSFMSKPVQDFQFWLTQPPSTHRPLLNDLLLLLQTPIVCDHQGSDCVAVGQRLWQRAGLPSRGAGLRAAPQPQGSPRRGGLVCRQLSIQPLHCKEQGTKCVLSLVALFGTCFVQWCPGFRSVQWLLKFQTRQTMRQSIGRQVN